MTQSDANALASPEGLDPRDSHQMPRALAIMLGIAAALVSAQVAREFSSTLASAFMALNLVIVVWPIQKFLARYVPRFLASMVAGLVSIGVLVGIIGGLSWTIVKLVQELPRYSSAFTSLIDSVTGFAVRIGLFEQADLQEVDWLHELQNFDMGTITSVLSGVLSALSSSVTLIVLIIMILIFMILDSVDFSERMQRLGERHNPTLAWGLTSFASGTRKYWIVATIFGLIVALCDWVLLLALGVPLALVWAVLSFISNYIPNIGFIIGLIPPVLMAILALDPWTALWVVIGYSVLNVLIQTVIQPRFTGSAVGITPTVAVLSLLVWAYILGPLGALLAIPATLLCKTIFVDIDPKARWVNAFIASNPTTSDQDPVKLSNFLKRAKKVRKQMVKARKISVTPQPEGETTVLKVEVVPQAEAQPSADPTPNLASERDS